MAYLTIKINSESDAFATREDACAEMRRILKMILPRIEQGSEGFLYDINGNKCGTFDVYLGEKPDEESEDGES